jgi:VanZ family protein
MASAADVADSTPAVAGKAMQAAWLTAVARAILVLALLVVAVAVLLPNSKLATLRSANPWFSNAISRTEELWPAVDMVHVVMFAAVGLLAALAFPTARFVRLLLVMFVLAAATEFVQIWVPGRTSSLFEVLLDVVAGAMGLLVVLAARRASARWATGTVANGR